MKYVKRLTGNTRSSITGGNKLQTTAKLEDARAEVKAESTKSSAPPAGAVDSKSVDVSDSLAASALAALQSDVQPVGHDYVEEVGFQCGSSPHNAVFLNRLGRSLPYGLVF